MISSRILKIGGFFFTTGPYHRGKSSFLQYDFGGLSIFCFALLCFALLYLLSLRNIIWTNYSEEQDVGNAHLGRNRDYNGAGADHGALVPKRTRRPLVVISHFKRTINRQSLTKISM